LPTLDGTATGRDVTLVDLPENWPALSVHPAGYVTAVLTLIRESRQRLILVAPYLESKGIGRLQQELLNALMRGVAVTLVTQDAGSPASWASESLKSLCREARGMQGDLSVYTALEGTPVFLHSKLIVADGEVAIVGSANLTDNALNRNLETGVRAGGSIAVEIERVVKFAIDARVVVRAFGSG
jgi:phosphatidylserine/phosphatidylglycerophosphate/cardiolipin synthase-like enzyme